MANRVIPSSDDDFLPWLGNFSGKLPPLAARFNIAPAEITQLAADFAMFQWITGCLLPVDAAKQQFYAYKNLVRDGMSTHTGHLPVTDLPTLPTLPDPADAVPFGIVPRCAALVARIRDSANLTDAIAEDLRIKTTPPTVLAHPTGEATALPGSQVRLTWVKGTHQAVIVESQRGTETGWTDLGPKFSKPWVDTRPPLVPGQPEMRRYRLRFQDHDEPSGDYSTIMTVTTTP